MRMISPRRWKDATDGSAEVGETVMIGMIISGYLSSLLTRVSTVFDRKKHLGIPFFQAVPFESVPFRDGCSPTLEFGPEAPFAPYTCVVVVVVRHTLLLGG